MQLPAPTGVTARFYGPYNSSNATTWYYWVQALYPEGYSQLSAAGVTSAHAPASLGNGGFNAVQWNPAPGAIGYLVWRSTSSTSPGSGGTLIFIATSETGIKDDGTLTAQTGTPRFDGVFTARMIWDFAIDAGGTTGVPFNPSVSDIIPSNALVTGGFAVIDTTITGATAWSIGTSAGSSGVSLVDADSTLVAGTIVKLVPTTTPFLMTAAGNVDITFTGVATAGIVEVFVYYVLPSNPA